MAKFIAVQLKDKQETTQDAFKKFTPNELKKTLKCKKVYELDYHKKSNSELSELVDICEYKLKHLSRLLSSTYLDDISENRFGAFEDTKIFILSDDASSTKLAFDILKNDCIVKLFQLNDDDIINFTQSIDTIQSADSNINALNNAKDLCEKLDTIESDLNLSLLEYGAIDDIDEKILDIENNVEIYTENLTKIFDAKWN